MMNRYRKNYMVTSSMKVEFQIMFDGRCDVVRCGGQSALGQGLGYVRLLLHKLGLVVPSNSSSHLVINL